MKRRDPVLLGDVMRQFLDPAALDDNANQQRLVAFWPDVVGEYINRQTVRRWIKDRVLHVVIVSAPLRNELMPPEEETEDKPRRTLAEILGLNRKGDKDDVGMDV